MSNSEHSPIRLISAAACAADSRTPLFERYAYEVFTVEYITSGQGVLEQCGHTWHLGADDVYILLKGGTHRFWHDRTFPWHKTFFIVDGTLAETLVREYLPPGVCVFHHCRPLLHYFETLQTVYTEHRDEGRRTALLFHHLLSELTKLRDGVIQESSGPEFHLRAELDAAVGTPFRLERYSMEHNLTKSYLIRRFRNTFGSTPYEYLLERRIRQAEDLLRYTDLRIKEIADRLAFSGQGAFTHYFRLRTGQSPKEYRSSVAQKSYDELQTKQNESSVADITRME